jgi:hypothetical protein
MPIIKKISEPGHLQIGAGDEFLNEEHLPNKVPLDQVAR